MLYSDKFEDNCMRSYDLATKSEYSGFMNSSTCMKYGWDFLFLPNSTNAWPQTIPVPLSGPAPVAAPVAAPPTLPPLSPPVAPPAAPPVAPPLAAPALAPVASPVATPTLAPVAPPVAAPALAPIAPPALAPAAAPTGSPVTVPVGAPSLAPEAAPVGSPVAIPVAAPLAAPTSTPASAPVSAPVEAPIAAPVVAPSSAPIGPPANPPVATPTSTPLFPRVARLVIDNVAGRTFFGSEVTSMCAQIRALLSLASSDLVCAEELAPARRRATLENSYMSLNFSSATGGAAAQSVISSPSLRAAILAIPGTVSSGALNATDIVFDPVALPRQPSSPPLQVTPVGATPAAPTGSNVGGPDPVSASLGGIIGGIIAALVVIAIIIVVVLVLRRRNKKRAENHERPTGFEGTEYMAPLRMPDTGHLDSSKVGTDATGVGNHDWQIDYADLVFGEKIGSGYVEFAVAQNAFPIPY